MQKESFFKTVEWPGSCSAIFSLLPEIAFWVKDLRGRFMMVNPNFVKMCGLEHEKDLLDKTDYDIWPTHLADSYVKHDRSVMKSGKSLVNQTELIRNPDKSTGWFTTTKIPLFDKKRKVAGVAGFTVDLKRTDSAIKPILKMEPAVNYIMEHYTENIEVKDLAKVMCISVSTFERQFKKHFNETPIKYLNRIRMDAACHQLLNSELPLSDIALKTGFYDSSHFTRQFSKYTGKSPSDFRRLYAGTTGTQG